MLELKIPNTGIDKQIKTQTFLKILIPLRIQYKTSTNQVYVYNPFYLGQIFYVIVLITP